MRDSGQLAYRGMRHLVSRHQPPARLGQATATTAERIVRRVLEGCSTCELMAEQDDAVRRLAEARRRFATHTRRALGAAAVELLAQVEAPGAAHSHSVAPSQSRIGG